MGARRSCIASIGARLIVTDADLSASQLNFLRLHVKHVVEKWKWYFMGTQLRASAGIRKATITSGELTDLVMRGLMRRGGGEAVYATDDGRALVQ